jgi:hypothetical protein
MAAPARIITRRVEWSAGIVFFLFGGLPGRILHDGRRT